MTRETDLNNPGGIEHNVTIKWQGQSPDQPDARFVKFASPEYGIRAITRVLRSYERKGIDTVRGVIERWAPPVENDTEAYIDDVCKRCDMPSDAKISLEDHMADLIKAIVRHENGIQPYTEQQIEAGIALA